MIAIVLTGIVGQAQDALFRENACDIMQRALRTEIPNSTVTYSGSTLLITIPMAELATISDISTKEMRELLQNREMKNIMMEAFFISLGNTDHFEDLGFNYLQLIIKDDYGHNYKKYKSERVET